jgi:hypothetical protein
MFHLEPDDPDTHISCTSTSDPEKPLDPEEPLSITNLEGQ